MRCPIQGQGEHPVRMPPCHPGRGLCDLRQRLTDTAGRQGAPGFPGAARSWARQGRTPRPVSGGPATPTPHRLTSGLRIPVVSGIMAFGCCLMPASTGTQLRSDSLLWSRTAGAGPWEPEAPLPPEALSILTHSPSFQPPRHFLSSRPLTTVTEPHTAGFLKQACFFFKIHSKTEWKVQRFLHVSKM